MEATVPSLLDDVISCAQLVLAEPERVYDALTTAEGLDGWFTSGAEVDAQPGGTILFRWKDFGVDRVTQVDGGDVIEARRPERFVFRWYPDSPEYPTTVEIDFERAGEGTIIRLRESGFRDSAGGRRALLNCAIGWGEALTLVKLFVEHGIRL